VSKISPYRHKYGDFIETRAKKLMSPAVTSEGLQIDLRIMMY